MTTATIDRPRTHHASKSPTLDAAPRRNDRPKQPRRAPRRATEQVPPAPLVDPDIVLDQLKRELADGFPPDETWRDILEAGWSPYDCGRRLVLHMQSGDAGALLDALDFVDAELDHFERETIAEELHPSSHLDRPRAALEVARKLIDEPTNEKLASALAWLTDSPDSLLGEIVNHAASLAHCWVRWRAESDRLRDSVMIDTADLIRKLALWHDDLDNAGLRERADAVAARFRAALGLAQ